MKKLFSDLGVLTPFLASFGVLAVFATFHVHEMSRLDAAVAEQARLLDARAALQSARRTLLEEGAGAPDLASAAPHLRALRDIHAGDASLSAAIENLSKPGVAPAPALNALLEAAADAEARNADTLARSQSALWLRLWVLVGLGTLVVAYAGLMLLRALRERSALDDRLRYETTHDNLTSLPNRRFFLQWAERTIAQARRERSQMALLYIDLDGFRRVNDEQGREIGDRLLRVAARRFRERVRESDVLARIGSDEYVVLTQVDRHDPESVTPLAERLIATLSPPLLPQFGERYPVGASIGIAVYPPDGLNADELLHAAEVAMREAKAAGGNQFRFVTAAATAAT